MTDALPRRPHLPPRRTAPHLAPAPAHHRRSAAGVRGSGAGVNVMADDGFAGAGGCAICGGAMAPGARGRTCSRTCSARLREARKTAEWRKPRAYPTEVVEKVRHLYVDLGMTRGEVQTAIGRGYKVETIMARHGIPARPAIKRHQRGAANATWVGELASYAAAHTRVYSARGRAADHPCVDCGEQAKDWSYLGDCPSEQRDERGRVYSPDPEMYAARCRKCHRAYDASRRAA